MGWKLSTNVLENGIEEDDPKTDQGTRHPKVGTPEFESWARISDARPLGYRFLKRSVDIVGALVAILVCVALWPISLAILIISGVQAKASPIYMQSRVGKGGKLFPCLKLRTMVKDADDVRKYLSEKQLESWYYERKVSGIDPRITSFGRFMRTTSLDELPQFLNVLVGQMSIIGPRPIVQEELSNFTARELAKLLSMRPGITGWWQVTSRNDAKWTDGSRQEVELEYVRAAGVGMDIKIFFGTFGAMFSKRNG